MPPGRTVLTLSEHEFANFSALLYKVRFTQSPPSPLCWIKLFASPLRPQSAAVHLAPKWFIHGLFITVADWRGIDEWRGNNAHVEKQFGVNGWPAFGVHVCRCVLCERGDLEVAQRRSQKKIKATVNKKRHFKQVVATSKVLIVQLSSVTVFERTKELFELLEELWKHWPSSVHGV